MAETQEQFRKGALVEVSSDEADLRGAWFTATVLRTNSRTKKAYVEYETLTADEEGSKRLKEFVDLVNVRPVAPREADPRIEVSDEVDALHNDGWWEGVVTKVLGERFMVYFRCSKEEIEFGKEDLRLHREWVRGSWVPPLQDLQHQDTSSVADATKNEELSENSMEIKKGALVEVSSDEEGFIGAWFSAKVVKKIGNSKYLVEYQSLKTDDESDLLKEEADNLHIRPAPPKILQVNNFNYLEEVDAFYNEGWWVGVISKVINHQTYLVYFKETQEELEFKKSLLRLHQDWINGKWIRPSLV
ncbi:hypothetical protein Sjap_007242 [Stephania japonica]|uniref:Agenet domain-containing protein n=1 Tax=Stephania japonica TaxID=461633 RepID=A0AAP0JMA1_9MAGN